MYIQRLTAGRLEIDFRALTIAQIISLNEIPAHLIEGGLTKTLNAVVAETNVQVTEWTVQERNLVLSHYITAMREGQWMVYENHGIHEYMSDITTVPEPYSFEHGGNKLFVNHMTTKYAEAVERLVIVGRGVENKRASWVLGAMAALIRSDAEDGDLDEALAARIALIKELDEDEFNVLFNHFMAGMAHNEHFFNIWFDDDGVVILPRKDGVSEANPVRFRHTVAFKGTTKEVLKFIS